MLTNKTYDLPLTVVVTEADNDHLEINRLLAAAVINRSFCDLLLENPEMALAEGFQGEYFPLSAEERALLLSIRAGNLSDLARQLAQTFGEPVVKNPQPHAIFIDHFR
jgi:hypothetical protein